MENLKTKLFEEQQVEELKKVRQKWWVLSSNDKMMAASPHRWSFHAVVSPS